jgi:hypothetical protein
VSTSTLLTFKHAGKRSDLSFSARSLSAEFAHLLVASVVTRASISPMEPFIGRCSSWPKATLPSCSGPPSALSPSPISMPT